MAFTENLEQATRGREEAEVSEKKNKEREQLKQDFFYLPEITELSEKLEGLVKTDEKEKIENRLFFKYEKDIDEFDFKKSLKEVLLGENIGGIASSGILLENENGETLNKKEKEKIYGQLVSQNIEKKEKVAKIPKSANAIAEETKENVSNILGGNKIESAEKDILSRINPKNPEKASERLNNSTEREKNIKQASKLFFNKNSLSLYKDQKDDLIELSDSIIKGEKVVDEDLINILGNFVTDIEGNDYESLENGEKKGVNLALNQAFELQINKVLDGKVNYKRETVKKLKKEILNNNLTNPLEKLEKFKKLKDEVNTSVGSLKSKQEKIKKLKNRIKELNNKYKSPGVTVETGKQEEQMKVRKKIMKLKQQLKELNNVEEPKSGDIMGGSIFDTNSFGVEEK